jgi:hypothetical protein
MVGQDFARRHFLLVPWAEYEVTSFTFNRYSYSESGYRKELRVHGLSTQPSIGASVAVFHISEYAGCSPINRLTYFVVQWPLQLITSEALKKTMLTVIQ